MAQRSEIGDVYAAGLIQGVALVTFPAASHIFTSPTYYGLAAFGVGPLQEHAGLHLSTIFGLAALVALAMGALAVILKRGAVSTAGSERVPAG
jgi:hypothetical protein